MTVERWFASAQSTSVLLLRSQVKRHQPVFLRKDPSQSLQNGRFRRPIIWPAHKPQQSRSVFVSSFSSVVTQILSSLAEHFSPCPLHGHSLLPFPTLLPPVPKAFAEYRFPFCNLIPGPLVEEVVHSDHRLDCVSWRVCVTFSKHCVIHLLWRRILPICICVTSWDGGCLAR
jgi:hypothetical protein